MLSGATWSAAAIVGTAVFKIVVSSDSMKNATAINHGSSRLLESAREPGEVDPFFRSIGLRFVGAGGIVLSGRVNLASTRLHELQLSPIPPQFHPGIWYSRELARIRAPQSEVLKTGRIEKPARPPPRAFPFSRRKQTLAPEHCAHTDGP